MPQRLRRCHNVAALVGIPAAGCTLIASSYPRCAGTYSTLRIFSDDLSPEEVSATLGIQATESFHQGEPHFRGKLLRKANGWFEELPATAFPSDDEDARAD
jgi:hypothetical protein